VRMLEQLQEFIAREGWTDLRLLPFFSLVDRRRSLHEQTISAARARFPQLLTTEVPYWSEIERMSVRRAPLPASAPSSAAALLYARLWAEISGEEPRARAHCSGGAAIVTVATLAAAAGSSSTA
jgi:chromosome partitioning protein